jgi:hypothetical protein
MTNAATKIAFAGILLTGMALCGCQSRSGAVNQGLRRPGPAPVTQNSPSPASGWNNQPAPVAGNSIGPSTGLGNQPASSPSLIDPASPSRQMTASPYSGTAGAASRSTAIPSGMGQSTGTTWPQTGSTAPTTGSATGSTPAPVWPTSPSSPSSRITTPQDPTLPSTPSTSGSSYQTRYPSTSSVPTMPQVRNGDE